MANPLKIARTVAMTGAGAVVGTMVAAEKNDTGFNYSGEESMAPTFIGAGVGAAVGGIGLPLAGKIIKGSVLGKIR